MGYLDISTVGTDKSYNNNFTGNVFSVNKSMTSIFEPSFMFSNNFLGHVGCNTNPVTRVSATLEQDSKNTTTDNKYKQAFLKLYSDLKSNNISKDEFYTKFADLTENDLKMRIANAVPQIKKSLDKDDIAKLQDIFSFEGNFIHDILGAVNNDDSFTDKDKVEILQKLLVNNENLLGNCLNSLPALDTASKIEFTKSFTLFDKSIRITAASIINNSKTLNNDEKSKCLNVFGNTSAERKNRASQNENLRINNILYKEIQTLFKSIYPYCKGYNFLFMR